LASAKAFFKNPAAFYLSCRMDSLFLLWFFLPLIAVVALKSVLYDGWRHMFYIYPAYILIALTGLLSLVKFLQVKFQGLTRRILFLILSFGAVFGILEPVSFMVRYHPYQNVYFTALAGDMVQAKKNFDMDYWGLSYRKGLEYILQNDPDSEIKVMCFGKKVGNKQIQLLNPEDRKRLIPVGNPEEAKYFITTYRFQRKEYPYKNEFYSIKVGGAKILGVYKLR
jgi:hypothetical protein